MDHANLFQCSGRNLSGIHGRAGASARGNAGTCPLYRSTVLHTRRSIYSYLYGRLPFLRRESLAGVPEDRASNMTRRGTLAYYLAAWVIGCFIVSLLQWSGDAFAGMIEPASDLLTSYFFSLVFGAAAILLFSFLLRRAMRLARTHNLWIWL